VLFETRDTLRRGETVTTLFARHGLSDGDVSGLAQVLDLRRMRAGLVFHLRKSADDSVPQEIAGAHRPRRARAAPAR
jgi:hypothetical protein